MHAIGTNYNYVVQASHLVYQYQTLGTAGSQNAKMHAALLYITNKHNYYTDK